MLQKALTELMTCSVPLVMLPLSIFYHYGPKYLFISLRGGACKIKHAHDYTTHNAFVRILDAPLLVALLSMQHACT